MNEPLSISPPLLNENKWCFLEVDLSQAEARVVALLADDLDTLHLFDRIDLHSTTAGFVLGKLPPWVTTVSSITEDKYAELKEALKKIDRKGERFLGKKTRHGGNYDMGKHRHMIEVNNDIKRFGIKYPPISEWRAGENLKKFHQFTPKIREVYHKTIQEIICETRKLVNPFGRVRQFFERLDDSLFKEAYAQIPQSTIPDHLRMAGLRGLDRNPELRIIVESHDALLFQVRKNDVDATCKIIKEELEKPIDFSQCSIKRGQLVIPCEFQLSETNYRDLKEYHFAG